MSLFVSSQRPGGAATPSREAGSRHRATLTAVTDLDARTFLALVVTALKLKDDRRIGLRTRSIKRANIALVFEKDSTRTRCAFEVAAMDLGAQTTYLGSTGSHFGTEESAADSARVLGSMYDAIAFRGFQQATVETLARHAGVPVWNALTDKWHPTQMLADVMTMIEHHPGPMGDMTVGYVGDGRNNVARSLLMTAGLLGFRLRVGAPHLLQPPRSVVASACALAEVSGGEITVTDDPVEAVRQADFVYTDVWVSMGEPEAHWATRVPLLMPFRVTPDLMAATGRESTRFLHCLPAVHDTNSALGRRLAERFGLQDGAEVSDAVFASPASVVFEQAENRLHTVKALMWRAFEDS